jgi:glycosyltransferase involved in cell wall biosynthesis
MIRIAFITIGNSRRSNYLNGDTIRSGGGGASGTDTTNIIVAEQLARHGYEVVVATEELEPALVAKYTSEGKLHSSDKKIRGVQYCNLNFDGVENKEFDILHTCLWFKDYDTLPIKITKAVIYHSHMQWIYSISEILRFVRTNNLKLGFANISEWEKSMNQNLINNVQKEYPHVKTAMIPNPVMDDVINEVLATNPVRKPHKFVFHAAWARGGNVAVKAVKELDFPDSELHAFDYLMATHDHKDSFFRRHNGVDKKTLFTNIAESEYFIYPLYTPYQDVHKDTFSCVVAEAIALGAIVVTYPLGALPEYYDGYCAWLNFPESADPAKMQSEPLSKDLDGKFTCTHNIVDKIKYLEANPQVKEEIRAKGKDYILGRFNAVKVGNMWKDFIDDLLK